MHAALCRLLPGRRGAKEARRSAGGALGVTRPTAGPAALGTVWSLRFGRWGQAALLVPVPIPIAQLPATAAPGLSNGIKPKLTSRPGEPSPSFQITVIELLNM